VAHREKSSPGRSFRLMRDQDPTGVAGTGHVASGVHWPDGSVTLKWHTPAMYAGPGNISHFGSVTKMMGVHGHDGRTRMEYAGNEPAPARKLLSGLGDFAFFLGDFAERAEKGLNPSADTLRAAFGRLLDLAAEADPK